MPIEGPLKELGIHDVFQLLDLSRKTGALRVTSELRHNQGTIYFEEGTIVFAEIRSNPHPLGGLLLRTGKITERDLERARDLQERQGDKRRLGTILVALGAITQREVERQVRFQVEEVVFEVMSWNEGYFSFGEGAVSDVPTEVAVRIPVEALLMEGARRIDEWSRIESRIPHLGVVPTLAPPPPSPSASPAEGGGELDLLPPEWEVLALIDGERDVRALAGELGRSDFDVAKTLFGLESAGVIVLLDPGTARRGRPSTEGGVAELVAKAEQALQAKDFGAAGAAAEEVASLQPHDPTVHLLLGRLHLAQGRAPGAAEELRRALRLDPLLVAGHRFLGYALVALGRFAEALESWDQWERLAVRSEAERALLADVQRAREAARVFLGMGGGGGGGARMADDIRALSTQLAQDPQSLVFLRLGEALRRKGQHDAALRVALNGLERHPHLADAHDLYARVLTDKHDYERAFDEWDMALRLAPKHTGALKGLAFLYFKVGDVAQAEEHLKAAERVEPDDPTIAQALQMVRGGGPVPSPAPAPAAPAASAPPAPGRLDESRVFAGLEGAQQGLLLLDAAGRVLGGALRNPAGADVADAVAAYLAGVSQEAARTAKLLGLGAWTGLSAEGGHGNVHLAHPSREALLLVVRDRGVPLGRLAILAQRATAIARRWLEQQR